jgi:hypothetical protein
MRLTWSRTGEQGTGNCEWAMSSLFALAAGLEYKPAPLPAEPQDLRALILEALRREPEFVSE